MPGGRSDFFVVSPAHPTTLSILVASPRVQISPVNEHATGALAAGFVEHREYISLTVGHGHGLDWWRVFADELRRAGYDGVISIEYEDPLVAAAASVAEAAELLSDAVAEVVAR